MEINIEAQAKSKETLDHDWITIVSKNPMIKFDSDSKYEIIIRKK